MTNTKVLKLVESGMFIALSFILSLIRLPEMPYGGAITACSLLPIMLIAYKYGVPWGLLCGLAYGLIHGMFGIAANTPGFSIYSVIFVFLLDYIAGYSVLGLAGLFKNRIKNTALGLLLGIIVAGIAKLAAHFLSGVIFYGEYAEWYFSQDGFTFGADILEKFSGNALICIYSLIYNATYMIPEIILACIAACVLISIPVVKRRLLVQVS